MMPLNNKVISFIRLEKMESKKRIESQRIKKFNIGTNVGPDAIIHVYAIDSSHDDNEIENFSNIL